MSKTPCPQLSLEHKQWLTEIIQEVYKPVYELQYTEMYWTEEAGYVHIKFKNQLQPSPYVVNGGYKFQTYNVFSDATSNVIVHKTKESLKQFIVNKPNQVYNSYINRL